MKMLAIAEKQVRKIYMYVSMYICMYINIPFPSGKYLNSKDKLNTSYF